MTYQAPVDDIIAALKATGALDPVMMNTEGESLDEATVRAVLEEAGKFASERLDPLNRIGDRAGCRLEEGRVVRDELGAAYHRED